MKDEQQITIRIADSKPMGLKITPGDEEAIRTAEDNVNKLYESWKKRFGDNDKNMILARIAFTFAKLYQLQIEKEAALGVKVEQLEKRIDELLQNIE